MTSMIYHVAWLLVALALVAWLSAAITRVKRRNDARRGHAVRLAEALHRYAGWVVGQRLVALFQGEDAEATAALEEACRLRRDWFPELHDEMAGLLAVHQRLVDFLATQQALWLRDPTHWLASQHDKRFMALWHEHRVAQDRLLRRLDAIARLRRRELMPPRTQSGFA